MSEGKIGWYFIVGRSAIYIDLEDGTNDAALRNSKFDGEGFRYACIDVSSEFSQV